MRRFSRIHSSLKTEKSTCNETRPFVQKSQRCGQAKKSLSFSLYYPNNIYLKLYRGHHDDIGYLGIERISGLIKDRFFWPSMIKDVERYIKNCIRCINSKSYKEIAPLQPMLATHPMQLVHIDYLYS